MTMCCGENNVEGVTRSGCGHSKWSRPRAYNNLLRAWAATTAAGLEDPGSCSGCCRAFFAEAALDDDARFSRGILREEKVQHKGAREQNAKQTLCNVCAQRKSSVRSE